MARRKTVLKVRHLSETVSKGSKGAADKPSKTIARSQEGSLVQIAGLSPRVAQRKHVIGGFLPKDAPPKGTW